MKKADLLIEIQKLSNRLNMLESEMKQLRLDRTIVVRHDYSLQPLDFTKITSPSPTIPIIPNAPIWNPNELWCKNDSAPALGAKYFEQIKDKDPLSGPRATPPSISTPVYPEKCADDIFIRGPHNGRIEN